MSLTETQKGRPPAIHRSDAAEGSEETELSLDAIYHLLQNERRRGVISYLAKHDCPVTRSEVAEQVAAWENGTDVDQIDSQERKRVYIALHQVHLPKLDDAGVLEYDADRGTITPHPLLERVNDIIEDTSDLSATANQPSGNATSEESEGSDESSMRSLFLGLLPGVALGFVVGSVRSSIATEVLLLAAAVALLVTIGITLAVGRRRTEDD